MNFKPAFYTTFLAVVLISLLFSCKKTGIGDIPSVTVAAVTDITATTATSGGDIISDGGSAITARGVCWSTNQNPTIADSKTSNGAGTGSFVASMTGLTSDKTYYIRAYATNASGTGYSTQETFATLVADIDGNVYHTVTIGIQVWMVENLKVTKLNDGTNIPNITDDVAWPQLVTPGYCWYENDIANKAVYGAMYNWYAVETGKLCPAGWHVPSDTEWTTLTDFLGGIDIAGGKLKEAGTAHWESPNEGATNESGFTALPGGRRASDDRVSPAAFYDLGSFGYWWSSSPINSIVAWDRDMYFIIGEVGRYSYDMTFGYSVRCLRD